LLIWLRANAECPWHCTTCSGAAAAGHLDVLSCGCGGDAETILLQCSVRGASRNAAVGESERLFMGCGQRCFCSSAEGGQLEVFKNWLRANECPWHDTTRAKAAAGGHNHGTSCCGRGPRVARGESVIKCSSPLNVLKEHRDNSYDHSCYRERSDEYQRLMTDSPRANPRAVCGTLTPPSRRSSHMVGTRGCGGVGPR
jgi:hypothetical protein